MSVSKKKRDERELNQLLGAVFDHYGYDFRQYARDSVWRRVQQRLRDEQLDSLPLLEKRVVSNESSADALLKSLSINVTEMFRDPGFYQELRIRVLPELANQSHIKIWHAGCATGEEAFSMAILLSEEGLYKRSLIYATDFNNKVLDLAKKGILPLSRMRLNSKNYFAAGCGRSFSDYYHSNYDATVLRPHLLENISFFHHNLVTGSPLPEVQMIVCRNVLIYFNRELQQRVLELFLESLPEGGFLCLGSHESIKSDSCNERFRAISDVHRIFQKVA